MTDNGNDSIGNKIEGMVDGHDDPNRGPIDRAQNAMAGTDDPNRGPIDRAENAMAGTDDPNRGPLDRTANAVTGGTGGMSAATHGTSGTGTTAQGGVVSAVFDSDDEARAAVSQLRSQGISDASLSLLTQNRGTTTTANADGDVVDEEHTSILRGIFGGGALGAGLGVAALAIPGVGPLVAAGAIAAAAVPGAMAIGAAAGAALGSLNEVLKDHGISDEDAAYYGDHMKNGGVLVTVHPDGQTATADQIREVLYAAGGHNASRVKA